MNNKRRRRKTVLDLNTAESCSPETSNSKVKCRKTDGLFGNSLTHLLEQYNSDSEDDTPRNDKVGCLNEQVNDFLKEIQCIGSENEESHDKNNGHVSGSDPCQTIRAQKNISSLWQECFDESTGYPYYWHTETNQVTWEIPEELKLVRDIDGDIEKKSPHKDPPRNILPSGNPCKYPNHKLMNSIPEGMIPKDIVARNRFKQIRDDSYLMKNKSETVLDKRKKLKKKDEDSDDGRIEMITSFGSDNSDSDQSDDGRTMPNIERNIVSKMNMDDSENNASNGSACNDELDEVHHHENENMDDDADDDDDTDRVADDTISDDNNQLKNNSNQDNELKFSLVPGYADESDNEENSTIKNKTTEPLFPITSFDNNRSNERHFKIDPNVEESGGSETLQDSTETQGTDDTKVPNKIDEVPKANKFLEDLGTSTKAFQRKKRIAFDVSMNKTKNSEVESLARLQSEAAKESITMLAVTRGNDSRHGLGFTTGASSDDSEQTSRSPDQTTSHSTTSADGKKEGPTAKSIGFVKGETLTLTKNIEEPDKCTMNEDTQTIIEKLKFLSEGSQSATAVQIMNIQLQTLLSAWESGDLKDRYFINWLTGTNRELCRLEKAAAPPGWDCQWDRSHKRYYYRNEIDGETRWSYPDIIGGAEEMELCTTPPPPDVEEKIEDEEPDVASNKNSNQNPQSHAHDDQFGPKHQRNPNADEDQGETDHQCSTEKEHPSISNQRDELKTDKVVDSQIFSPSPPPPPRISGEDLTRNRKERRDAERKNSNMKIIKKEVTKVETISECKQPNDQGVKMMTTAEIISKNCEPIMTSSHHSHLLASNPPHAEPLPPGVDQPEMPYAITATSIEPSVIFTATAPQTTASIYAATMQDPTNISIIGHHHPALVQNQLVHYPAYHSHLQNQAIIAAANRLAGPDTVQFMLDYTRIYGNTQVIAKPPVKTNLEPLGTALDSFYSDIASLENQPVVDENQQTKHGEIATSLPMKLHDSQTTVLASTDLPQISNTTTDATTKDKKKKKVKIVISKKQKQVSSMVAKWKKAQNYEGIN